MEECDGQCEWQLGAESRNHKRDQKIKELSIKEKSGKNCQVLREFDCLK